MTYIKAALFGLILACAVGYGICHTVDVEDQYNQE